MEEKKSNKQLYIREGEAKYYVKGERLYRRLQAKLEKEHLGKVIAINPDSGEYVIGQDELETAKKAQKRFPRKPLDYFRIGEKVMHKQSNIF